MSRGQKTLEPHWGYADRAVPCTTIRALVQFGCRISLLTIGNAVIWNTLGHHLEVSFSFGEWRDACIRQSTKSASCLESGESEFWEQQYDPTTEESIASYNRQYFLRRSSLDLLGRTTRLQVVISREL